MLHRDSYPTKRAAMDRANEWLRGMSLVPDYDSKTSLSLEIQTALASSPWDSDVLSMSVELCPPYGHARIEFQTRMQMEAEAEDWLRHHNELMEKHRLEALAWQPTNIFA